MAAGREGGHTLLSGSPTLIDQGRQGDACALPSALCEFPPRIQRLIRAGLSSFPS